MGRSYDVAVKSLIQSSSEIDKIKLLQEAAIMGQFQHPNIVKLFGVMKQGNLVCEHIIQYMPLRGYFKALQS